MGRRKMRGPTESLTAYSVLKPSKSFLGAILKTGLGGKFWLKPSKVWSLRAELRANKSTHPI